MAAMRAQRLASRDLRLPPPRSEADLAATAWACEMTASKRRAGTNVPAGLDFDRVLGDLEGVAAI